MTSKNVIAATVMMLAWAMPALAQQRVDLRPRFEKGQTVRYVMTQKSSGESASKDMGEQKTKIEQEIVFSLRALESSKEAGSTVELVYDAIKLNMDAGEMKLEFDSSKPATDDDMLGSVFRGLVGQKLTLTIDPQGNITKLEGGAGLAPPGLLGGGAANLTSKSGVSDLLGPIVSIRKGDGTVAVGESWTNVDEIGEGAFVAPFKMRTTHTLKRAGGGTAEVEVKSSIESDSSSPGSGARIKSASTNGSYLWDTERGMLRSLDMKQSFKAEQDVGGTVVSVSQESETKIKRKD